MVLDAEMGITVSRPFNGERYLNRQEAIESVIQISFGVRLCDCEAVCVRGEQA